MELWNEHTISFDTSSLKSVSLYRLRVEKGTTVETWIRTFIFNKGFIIALSIPSVWTSWENCFLNLVSLCWSCEFLLSPFLTDTVNVCFKKLVKLFNVEVPFSNLMLNIYHHLPLNAISMVLDIRWTWPGYEFYLVTRN